MPFCTGTKGAEPGPRFPYLGPKGNHHRAGRRKEMEETFSMFLKKGKRAFFIRDPTTCLNKVTNLIKW